MNVFQIHLQLWLLLIEEKRIVLVDVNVVLIGHNDQPLLRRRDFHAIVMCILLQGEVSLVLASYQCCVFPNPTRDNISHACDRF